MYLIQLGMFLASLDIKDTFYSIPVYKTHQKFLKFLLKGKALQFTAMPNGYIDAMPVFNKVLKQPFAYLRKGCPQLYIWMIYYLGLTLLRNVRTMFSTPFHA